MEKSPNTFNKLALVTALGLGSLGLAACGEAPENKDVTIEMKGNGNVSHQYLDDGSRITKIHGRFSDTLAYCDGDDLVEQTHHHKYMNSGSGNAIARSVDHPACDDGRLSPEDFQPLG